jgi:hypothetical protein
MLDSTLLKIVWPNNVIQNAFMLNDVLPSVATISVTFTCFYVAFCLV